MLMGFIGSFSRKRRNLGVHRRDLSEPSARQGPKPRQFHSLVHERAGVRIFPVVAAYSRSLPFVFFAGMAVVQFPVVLAWFPETSQVSLEQMQKNPRNRVAVV